MTKVYLVQARDYDHNGINCRSTFSNKKHAEIYAKLLEKGTGGDYIDIDEFVLDEINKGYFSDEMLEEYRELISKE